MRALWHQSLRLGRDTREGAALRLNGGACLLALTLGCARTMLHSEPTGAPVDDEARATAEESAQVAETNCTHLPEVSSEVAAAARRDVGQAVLHCFATALNEGDEKALGKLIGLWMNYYFESVQPKELMPKLLSEKASGVRYADTPLIVQVDDFGQVTGVLQRLEPEGSRREVFLRLHPTDGKLKIVAINDADEQKLSNRCSEAVSSALSSLESVQKWQASLPEGINPGGFAEPLNDGYLEMSLGASLPDRMETIYWATVDSGYLRISQYGYPLAVSEGARAQVRQSCVRFDLDCEEACEALGQCTRRDDTCVATSDNQCQGSTVCEKFGRCTARPEDGTCIATSQARCDTVPHESCYGLACQLIGTDCTAPPLDDELDK